MFIKPCHGYVRSFFDPHRLHPNLKVVRPHVGIDYGNHENNDIYAMERGKVTKAWYDKDGYGHCIFIRHVLGGIIYDTVYAHLNKRVAKVGDVVSAGDVIGEKGTTGNSTGIHCHVEVHRNGYLLTRGHFPNAVDPALYIFDPDIKWLQVELNKLDYGIEEDGFYGEDTKRAIRLYQKRNGLHADSYAGESTFESLRKKESPVVPPVANDHVAAVDEPRTGLTFSSPTLKKETEESIKSHAHREIVVKAAVEAGAHNSWLVKFADGTITDDDIFALAMKYIIDTRK